MSYRYTLPTTGYLIEATPPASLGLTGNTLIFIDSAGTMSDADAIANFEKERATLEKCAPVVHVRRLIHRTADGDRVLIDWTTITPLQVLLSTPLTTPAEAEAWMRSMTALGYGTHPDDPAAEIIDSRTGEALFTDEQAPLHDARMEEVFALLSDPYDVALDAFGGGLA
jgi:hypothetical protein